MRGEILADIGLNLEQIGRDQTVSSEFAEAYYDLGTEHDDQLVFLAAATQFRRAGGDALLLDRTASAKKLFDRSAECYRKAGSPFASLIANLGRKGRAKPFNTERRLVSANDVFELWNPAFAKHSDRGVTAHEQWRDQLEDSKTEGVGLLGLPVETYLKLYDAMAVSDSDDDQEIQSGIFPFLAQYDAAIRRARRDRFHWRNIATPFHPIEPEVIAVLVAVMTRRRSWGDAVLATLHDLSFDFATRAILRNALEQYLPDAALGESNSDSTVVT